MTSWSAVALFSALLVRASTSLLVRRALISSLRLPLLLAVLLLLTHACVCTLVAVLCPSVASLTFADPGGVGTVVVNAANMQVGVEGLVSECGGNEECVIVTSSMPVLNHEAKGEEAPSVGKSSPSSFILLWRRSSVASFGHWFRRMQANGPIDARTAMRRQGQCC